MRIEIWSDFTCPFCYLGMRNLQAAMQKFPYRDAIKIEVKSFQLAPEAKYGAGNSMEALLTERYGFTKENIGLMIQDIVEQANAVNLTIQLENIKTSNTLHAHRLTKYAEKQGKESELMEELFKGYFNEALNLSDRTTLLRLAEKVDLDREDVEEFLSINKLTQHVCEDEAVAEEIGINDVPFYIFNEQHAVAGFRSESIFTEILQQLWENDPGQKWVDKKEKVKYCVGNDCER